MIQTTASYPKNLQNVVPGHMAAILRAVLGFPPDSPAPGELAANVPKTMPKAVQELDGGAWIAWCLVGLLVCAEGLPTMRHTRTEAQRVAMALAMLRTRGNLSAAARILRISRRALRENLRAVGLYPWRIEPSTLYGDEDGVDGR